MVADASHQMDLSSMIPFLLIACSAALIPALGQAFVIRRMRQPAPRLGLLAVAVFASMGSLFSIFSLLQRLKDAGQISGALYLFYMAVTTLLAVSNACQARLRARQ